MKNIFTYEINHKEKERSKKGFSRQGLEGMSKEFMKDLRHVGRITDFYKHGDIIFEKTARSVGRTIEPLQNAKMKLKKSKTLPSIKLFLN